MGPKKNRNGTKTLRKTMHMVKEMVTKSTVQVVPNFGLNRVTKPNDRARNPVNNLRKRFARNNALRSVDADISDKIDLSPNSRHPTPSNLHLGLFEIGQPLGRGKFGQVFLARHRLTDFVCAIKMISKQQVVSEGEEMLIRREIEIHSNLSHPSILRFHTWFHDEGRIYLVLEYACGGEVFSCLRKQGRFSEDVAARYIAQMAQALHYLHKKNIMHRDIKPENILLGLHDEVKLADFGYSVHSSSNLRATLCGTLDYIPPEIAKQLLKPGKTPQYYTSTIDLWSLGVLTYEFLVGKAPFEEKTREATEKRIVKGKLKVPDHVSKEAKGVILALLTTDAEMRMSLEELLAHPWILGFCGPTYAESFSTH